MNSTKSIIPIVAPVDAEYLTSRRLFVDSGLKMSAAQEIWARWDNQDEQILPAGGNVDTFLDFFVNQVAELPSDPEHTSVKQWSELLSNCDYQLNAETRAAAYTIRGYWEFDLVYGSDIFEKMIPARVHYARSLLRKRYRRLLHIRETSLQRERYLQEAMGAMEASFTNMEIGRE